jgi:hypothetical protein
VHRTRLGGGGPRADVECCAPSRRRGIHAPGPPPCAVTPRTFDDMFAAFRANLAATTRFGLDEWLELLAAEGVRSADAFHWLRREHGLGDATAAAIATAVQPP